MPAIVFFIEHPSRVGAVLGPTSRIVRIASDGAHEAVDVARRNGGAAVRLGKDCGDFGTSGADMDHRAAGGEDAVDLGRDQQALEAIAQRHQMEVAGGQPVGQLSCFDPRMELNLLEPAIYVAVVAALLATRFVGRASRGRGPRGVDPVAT